MDQRRSTTVAQERPHSLYWSVYKGGVCLLRQVLGGFNRIYTFIIDNQYLAYYFHFDDQLLRYKSTVWHSFFNKNILREF